MSPSVGGGGDARGMLAALTAALDGSGPPVGLGSADAGALDLPDGTAAVVATSGSSGYPKRVILSCDALLASARATAERIGAGSWLLALPAGYVGGLQVLTRSIVAGTVPSTLEGPFDPRAFTELAGRMPRPAYTSLVPAQLSRLLDDGIDLTAFAAILVGGQRLDAALHERATRAGARVIRTYGATETCGGCVYDGVALDGVRLRIARGEVQVAGPMLADGYLDDRPATDAAFAVDPDGTRWYRTGDLAELQGGALAVTGRADDVYVSGGINVSVARVEDAVRTVAGLEHAVVVAVPDERWGEASVLVVATEDDAEPLLAAARDAVTALIGPHARPSRIAAVAVIPHLASGKPDRVALRALAAG